MPHCIIETSDSVAVHQTDLLTALQSELCETQLFNSQDIKLRAITYTQFIEPQATSFVHVTVKILAGRTVEQKKTVGLRLYERIETLLSATDSVSISVNTVDVSKEVYVKGIYNG